MEEIAAKLESIWEKDLLGRRQDAQYLGNYLSKRFQLKPDEPGFVLAVDGEWGFGKSFMIKRWQEEFALQNYPTVFFNAWENDYTDDPLLAFIAELNTGLEEFFEHVPKIQGVKRGVKITLKKAFVPVIKAAGLAITKKTLGIGLDEIKEILSEAPDNESKTHVKVGTEDLKEISEKLQNAFEKAMESHKTKKAAIANFKASLSDLIVALQRATQIQLPLFVFVDELDRCRPDYAIELLEGIKHLFGVPGVYFVVATNTIQLGESVKAVYGNGFDGHRYLKRFFDIQYTLPEPNNTEFAHSLFSKMEVIRAADFVHGLNYLVGFNFSSIRADANLELLVQVFSTHANAFHLGLRDQQQIVEMLEAAFIQLKGEKIHIFFLVFLACTYHQDRAAFNSITKGGIADDKFFDKVRVADKDGTINHSLTSERDRQTTQQRVNLVEIASVYFTHREIPLNQRARVGYNVNFPQILMRDVEGNPNGKVWRPHFCAYFDVIRHAGGFNNHNKFKSSEN